MVYAGCEFTIEWYFNDRGKSEAFEYFAALSTIQKKKFAHLFYVLGDTGKLFNKEKFCYEGDQIYALKASSDRFLCFFYDGVKVIVAHAYEKKEAKMPQKEKQKVLKMKIDYIKRCKLGKYYD